MSRGNGAATERLRTAETVSELENADISYTHGLKDGLYGSPVENLPKTHNEGLHSCGRPSRGRYVQGCRCWECRKANAEYSLEQAHRGNHDRTTAMVSACSTAKCRHHVRQLIASGVPKRRICRDTGVPRSSLESLLNGHRNTPKSGSNRPCSTHAMSRKNYRALMAYDGGKPAGGALVDSGNLRAAVRWCVDHGASYALLSRMSGVPYCTVYSLRDRCTARTLQHLGLACLEYRKIWGEGHGK